MNLRALLLIALFAFPLAAQAGEEPKPDDVIAVNLTSEGWVQAKAARVMISVNAAVMGDKASGTRDAMLKAVTEISKADWRMTNFNRGQDPTGLEQWSATFEARLPEADISGIHQKVKTLSKAGMQLSVMMIDFTPSLAEMEAARADLRKQIMADASKELERINAAYPGRNFRIAQISFDGAMASPIARPHVMMMRKMEMTDAAVASAPASVMGSSGDMETSQHLQMNANVTFAALAPVSPQAAIK